MHIGSYVFQSCSVSTLLGTVIKSAGATAFSLVALAIFDKLEHYRFYSRYTLRERYKKVVSCATMCAVGMVWGKTILSSSPGLAVIPVSLLSLFGGYQISRDIVGVAKNRFENKMIDLVLFI